MEQVILVDEKDNELGLMEKMEAHRKGLLHRAFSVFLFNSRGEMLLQKRAASKYHSGGLWTNACCSHPRKNETATEAAVRRLKEELGVEAQISHAFEFTYKAELDNDLQEHEFDHVFIGIYDGDIHLNKEEADDYKYIDVFDLIGDVQENPDRYTIWFKIALPKVISHIHSD